MAAHAAMTSYNEYVPTSSDSPPPQDEHRPKRIFQLAPVEDDLTGVILRTRIAVIEDCDIAFGARLMFVYILDLSLRRTVNVRPGVVTISQTKLAERLRVSVRTIWNWRRELCDRGVVWISEQPMPNTWSIDTYHVSAIDPPGSFEQKASPEGLWGNGRRRFGPPKTSLGAREPGQTHLPLPSNPLRRTKKAPKKSQVLGIASQSRNPLPLSAETGCGCPPKQVAGVARNRLRATPETGCGGEPKQVAGDARNRLRATPETGCEHKETLGASKRASEVQSFLTSDSKEEKASPVHQPLQEEGGEDKTAENDFMARSLRVFGKKCGEDWGGYWRVLYRQNPGKAERVLTATAEEMKTRVIRNPGGYAKDLWGRFAD